MAARYTALCLIFPAFAFAGCEGCGGESVAFSSGQPDARMSQDAPQGGGGAAAETGAGGTSSGGTSSGGSAGETGVPTGGSAGSQAGGSAGETGLPVGGSAGAVPEAGDGRAGSSSDAPEEIISESSIDAALDGDADGPEPACADGSVEQGYGQFMAGCDGAVSQCQAETLCGADWHLCLFGEYIARGGTEVKATAFRWLASCVRENCGAPQAPTDSICSSCDGQTTSWQPPALWDCQGSAVDGDPGCQLGVISWDSKRKVAESVTACAYLRFYGTAAQVGAVCCR